MNGLDTNVLIRHLVQDDPQQSALATQFIEGNCTQDSPCFIGPVTLSEVAWVLERSYKQDRDTIASVLEQLLLVDELVVGDPDTVWQAIRDYQKSNADFPDHLSARLNLAAECETTVTFDKKAGSQPGFTLLSTETSCQ